MKDNVQIIKSENNIWIIEDGFVRFFLLEGNDKSMLIDSGFDCPDAIEIAKSITNKPIILVNTHGDGDHTSGTDGFDEIHISEADFYNCKLNEKYKAKLNPVYDGEIFNLGERCIKVVTVPGHTKGSVVLIDIDNHIMFAGDTIQDGSIFMFGNHRDTNSYEDSLIKLLNIADEYDTIYSSHGKCILPRTYVQSVLDSWMEVKLGKIQANAENIHGINVNSYKTDYCGFYLL